MEKVETLFVGSITKDFLEIVTKCFMRECIQVKNHMISMNESYECHLCDEKFSFTDTLARHKETIHHKKTQM